MYKQHADKNHMIVLFVWDNTIGEILKENEPYNLRIRSNLLQDVYVVVVFKCSYLTICINLWHHIPNLN